MDIKNRLNQIKNNKTEQSIDYEIKEKTAAVENKFDNEIVVNIITSQLEAMGNIIFVTDSAADNNYAAEYFENCVKDTPRITVFDKNITDINIENSIINIIPLVSPKSFVNVLEQILLGTCAFVMGIHLNSYDDVIEKLKILITLNSNLQCGEVNLLLANSNSIIVNIQPNENGTLYVKTIDKIKGSDKKIYLNNLYSFIDKPVFIQTEHFEVKQEEKTPEDNTLDSETAGDTVIIEDEIIKEEEPENIEAKGEVIEVGALEEDKEKQNPAESLIPENKAIPDEISEEMLPVKSDIQPKINKYKLLKEKIKRKKKSEEKE